MTGMKWAYCDGAIAYDPYTETMEGKMMHFHAKAWADALKASKFAKWAYCGGLVAYKPVTKMVSGKMLNFHAKAWAEAMMKKQPLAV